MSYLLGVEGGAVTNQEAPFPLSAGITSNCIQPRAATTARGARIDTAVEMLSPSHFSELYRSSGKGTFCIISLQTQQGFNAGSQEHRFRKLMIIHRFLCREVSKCCSPIYFISSTSCFVLQLMDFLLFQTILFWGVGLRQFPI